MTKQEAIDLFEHNWTKLENHDYTEGELVEALEMAIETLKRKPDIRLKALMKNLKDRDWEMFATYRIDEVEARGIIEAIENLEKIK